MSGSDNTVNIELPFEKGRMDVLTNEAQRRAAWALYVELVTRIAVQRINAKEGTLRGALSSLHKVFGITREVLKNAGPEVASSPQSLGAIAIEVLNDGIRPFLSKWHPLLEDFEYKRPPHLSENEHEETWDRFDEMSRELRAMQANLRVYANMLARLSGARHIE